MGHPTAGSTEPFGFTGELHDGDLVHLRARWYHPNLGTFTSRDPFAGFDTQPYSLHPYQYAYSNPVLWTDPSGRCVGWIWDDPTCEFIGWDRVQEGDLNWEEGRPWGGAALDFIPVVGDVKGLIEVFTGCDLVTGEDLGHWRWAGLLFMSELRSVRHVDAVVTHADDVRHIPPHQGLSEGGARSDMAPEARTRVDELCFNSFSAETLVSTEDGLRPISEIAIGARVWAYDEATDEHGLFPVTDVIVHTDPTQVHLLLDGELLETTPEHPFYTLERGWVDAGDLWVGAHIRQADGSYGRVQFLTVEREDQVLYNLTVDEAHTFFVGAQRWLVHNSGCPDIIRRPGDFEDMRDKHTESGRAFQTAEKDKSYFYEPFLEEDFELLITAAQEQIDMGKGEPQKNGKWRVDARSYIGDIGVDPDGYDTDWFRVILEKDGTITSIHLIERKNN